MRWLIRIGAMLALLTTFVLGTVFAESSPTQVDRRGPVTVTVTLVSSQAAGAPLTVKVALNTHSVPLDGIAFDKAVALRVDGRADVAPSAVSTGGSGHHREAVVTFSPPAGGAVQIVVKDVGGVAERLFAWDRVGAR